MEAQRGSDFFATDENRWTDNTAYGLNLRVFSAGPIDDFRGVGA
jgi:hypothetical protein